jgi:hypothetical protein
MRTSWIVIAMWVAACGGAMAVPSEGGREWTEVSSDHFVLWTDGSSKSARELLAQFERRRRIMVTALNEPSVKSKAFVVALRNEAETSMFVPPAFTALAWNVNNAIRQPGILIAMNHRWQQNVINHELAHVVSYGIIKHQPSWLAEGLAGYFEMAELQPDDAYADIGYPRSDFPLLLNSPDLPSVASLFSCHERTCKDARFYAMSWAVFSFLVNHHPAPFGRYLQRLNEGAGEDAQIWRESFPDLPPEKLDLELYSWLRIGEYRPLRIKLARPKFSIAERRLGDADVLALRSFLFHSLKDDEATARRDAEAALAIDRTNVVAHMVKASLDLAIAADVASAVAAAHPDDFRAWLLVALSRPDGAGSDAAYARACSLAANVVDACARVAR